MVKCKKKDKRKTVKKLRHSQMVPEEAKQNSDKPWEFL